MPSETLLSVSDGILTNTVLRRKTAGFLCVSYADVSTHKTAHKALPYVLS
ncbi:MULTISPECIES: hypothetical protein [Neisseria]|uniref:Uncharacterized protein n=1 Tax=Neisseria polysaccharea TaxID=489 RepID=A0ABV1JMX2_NEIPO|nr:MULTISPECIES: hypothetical protein [Neisseria]